MDSPEAAARHHYQSDSSLRSSSPDRIITRPRLRRMKTRQNLKARDISDSQLVSISVSGDHWLQDAVLEAKNIMKVKESAEEFATHLPISSSRSSFSSDYSEATYRTAPETPKTAARAALQRKDKIDDMRSEFYAVKSKRPAETSKGRRKARTGDKSIFYHTNSDSKRRSELEAERKASSSSSGNSSVTTIYRPFAENPITQAAFDQAVCSADCGICGERVYFGDMKERTRHVVFFEGDSFYCPDCKGLARFVEAQEDAED